MAVSYVTMLSFGIPMLYRPPPMALKPPTTTAFSRPATIQATNGPPTSTGPIAGTQKNAAPNNRPQRAAPESAPLPPGLHAFSRVVVANDLLVRVIILPHD